MNCKVIREDGTVEILKDFKHGRWDAINRIRVQDENREYIDLNSVDIAAEVVDGRGDLELIYLSDKKIYYLESI